MKKEIWIVASLMTGFLTIVCYCFFYYSKMQASYSRIEFNGTVENIVYNVKREPTVTIKSIQYDLPSQLWNFENKIQKGDSLIKFKNTLTIRLIKKSNGRVMEFK